MKDEKRKENSTIWAGEEQILIILRGRYQFRPQAHHYERDRRWRGSGDIGHLDGSVSSDNVMTQLREAIQGDFGPNGLFRPRSIHPSGRHQHPAKKGRKWSRGHAKPDPALDKRAALTAFTKGGHLVKAIYVSGDVCRPLGYKILPPCCHDSDKHTGCTLPGCEACSIFHPVPRLEHEILPYDWRIRPD